MKKVAPTSPRNEDYMSQPTFTGFTLTVDPHDGHVLTGCLPPALRHLFRQAFLAEKRAPLGTVHHARWSVDCTGTMLIVAVDYGETGINRDQIKREQQRVCHIPPITFAATTNDQETARLITVSLSAGQPWDQNI